MVTFLFMDTNQQPQPKNAKPKLSLVLQSRELNPIERIEYQCWLDKKSYQQDSKY